MSQEGLAAEEAALTSRLRSQTQPSAPGSPADSQALARVDPPVTHPAPSGGTDVSSPAGTAQPAESPKQRLILEKCMSFYNSPPIKRAQWGMAIVMFKNFRKKTNP